VRFRQHQDDARWATRRLLVLFVLTVLLTVGCTNGALALIWRLQTGGLFAYPRWFFETNTLVALGFILGGSWIETLRLRDGGAHVAALVGGRELLAPGTLAERRLRNIVDEVAIASGLKSPRVFVLDREDAINAFAAGWEQQDSVVAVTRGALERLTRDELQGVVAHEFGHILNGDTRLNMRLIGYVFGLQMIFNFGRGLMQATDDRGRRTFAVLAGVALVAAGFIGWMAGRLLKAAVSRQREFLADAHAVQFTRLPEGIGGALRKISSQMRDGKAQMHHANAEVLSHLLLSGGSLAVRRWLATHPPLEARLQRIYGRSMAPLAAPVIAVPEASDVTGFNAMAFVPQEFDGTASAPSVPVGRAAPAAASDDADADARAVAERTLRGLREFTPPALLRVAILAFLVPARELPEHDVWGGFAAGVSGADAVLGSIGRLSVRRRQPWLEHLLVQAGGLPAPERRLLREQALQIVRADGRLALHELLAALLIHHDMSPRHGRLAVEPRHLLLSALGSEVAIVTTALGTLLPPDLAPEWSRGVLAGLGLGQPGQAPDMANAAHVRRAIERLGRLAMTQTPALAKQWVACQPVQPMVPAMAEALRALCLLVDTPMPPQLAGMFDVLGGDGDGDPAAAGARRSG
jgi:Zn-dependent protease with chaperone function